MGATLLVLASSLLASVPASADSKVGLAISPPTFEFNANAGDAVSNSIRVENITDQPLPVTVDIRNFTAMGEKGEVSLSKGSNRYSMSDWISVTPTAQTIAAKDSAVFNYTIHVPQNAEPGGRFSSIVFSVAPQKVTGGSGVAIGQEVGSLLFLRVAGDVKESAQIESFDTGSILHEYGPVHFQIRVKDTGNVQFQPRGTVSITNMFGKPVQTIPVNAHNVLPGAVRQMDASWQHKWLFGQYNATVSLVYGSKGQIITASTTFWGFPFRIILVVLIILAVLGFIIFRGRRRFGRAFKVLFGKD